MLFSANKAEILEESFESLSISEEERKERDKTRKKREGAGIASQNTKYKLDDKQARLKMNQTTFLNQDGISVKQRTNVDAIFDKKMGEL